MLTVSANDSSKSTHQNEYLNPAVAQVIDGINFYEYPLDSEYLISEQGQVYNTRLGRLLAQSTIKNGKGFEYWTVNVHSKRTRVHRMLALTFIANPHGYAWIDHASTNTLDNRLANLRWCTPAMNNQNRNISRTNTSGYMGVSRTTSGKWGAQIHIDGKNVWLGTHPTETEAARIYDRAALDAGYWHHNGLLQPKNNAA